ncbi:MAG: hypothetical protein IKY57_07350 [Alistipes sp.]|nr:hypothetical protein [Alistipes sp.]
MKITKISNDFTPLHKGILFGIDTETEEPTDLLVEIIEGVEERVLARQHLRSVTKSQVNIAPYIERTAERTPSQLHNLAIVNIPTTTHRIRIGEVVSEGITTSINSDIVTLPSIVSTMPNSRRIARNERDELLIIANKGSHISITMTTGTNDGTTILHYATTGVALLSISPTDLGVDSGSMDVTVSCNDSRLGVVHYEIVPSFGKGVRLAWISERGSIERYTFPAVISSQYLADKHSIRTAEGGRVVSSTTRHIISTASRYEPHATAEALAYIASSPRVWIEDENGCTEVEVLSSTTNKNLFNEPDCVNIELLVWSREEVVC